MTAEQLWLDYCEKFNIDKNVHYEAWAFGGAPDNLAALVMEGVKTGTASAYEWYLDDPDEPLPKAGDYSVILNSKDEAMCVTKTTKTAVVPFDEVSADHARKEGEGDRSLSYWRTVHEDFFKSEFEGTKHQFHEKMPVLTEEFEVVYSLYEVSQMTDAQAKELCGWRYEGEYEEYNFPSWEECKKAGWVLTDQTKRKNAYFSVLKEGQLFAFFHIMERGDHIELGVGMKPEYCGNHMGSMLIELALAKIEELYYGLPIQLSVRTHNKRAIACYEKVGFSIKKEYNELEHHTSGRMYLMILDR